MTFFITLSSISLCDIQYTNSQHGVYLTYQRTRKRKESLDYCIHEGVTTTTSTTTITVFTTRSVRGVEAIQLQFIVVLTDPEEDAVFVSSSVVVVEVPESVSDDDPSPLLVEEPVTASPPTPPC